VNKLLTDFLFENKGGGLYLGLIGTYRQSAEYKRFSALRKTVYIVTTYFKEIMVRCKAAERVVLPGLRYCNFVVHSPLESEDEVYKTIRSQNLKYNITNNMFLKSSKL
jgi:hypothetical protein